MVSEVSVLGNCDWCLIFSDLVSLVADLLRSGVSGGVRIVSG
ncbi:hypothetical protein HanRHA438_Chr17g0820211 [Helianthus annuus]|nr:hypothetical protein HanHA89_Chr17g0712461 [Helianthus annuus]KAJ0632946.1 hypothetical protein HanLR1_Chr17g0670981 [Helianthus annuus]KAJ0826955.1 hypothetical protein HanRHA438_Chr17g0820211 [Helianthus annuus]